MIIQDLRQRATLRQDRFDALVCDIRIDAAEMNAWLRSQCALAEQWLRTVPVDTGFGLFIDRHGKPCCPDFANGEPDGVRIHKGARKGVWPTSPDISHSMLKESGIEKNGTGSDPSM